MYMLEVKDNIAVVIIANLRTVIMAAEAVCLMNWMKQHVEVVGEQQM